MAEELCIAYGHGFWLQEKQTPWIAYAILQGSADYTPLQESEEKGTSFLHTASSFP